jgi:squalene-hopene/tetraprenyl-beta-curcumene cyclase
MTQQQKQQTIEMVWRHQREDGGWSIRSFAAPEQWGNGNRAGKLRSEPEFADPPSDGHQTGLAVFVLREAGVSAGDERIQRAAKWLKTNQRQSGRWWTRSLNTDTFHFITYSGTFYSLLALQKCDALN